MNKTKILTATLGLALLILIFRWPYVSAMQDRGQGVRIKVETGAEINLYDESHALVIAVSNYTNGWRDLPGAARDLDAVNQVLEANGFKVEKLLNPTRDALDKAIRLFINTAGVKERNRLLIYFVGHGHTESMRDGRDRGYVVAADAPVPEKNRSQFYQRAISMDQLETYALDIQSKHALFVFDSCFSGSIFETRSGKSVPPEIASKTAGPVRQFITAGTKNQTVPDDSIFRLYFVRAFDQREGDLNGDGFVTGEELGMYLAGSVARDTKDAQTPRFGKINNARLNIGDIVFALPKPTPPPPSTTPPPITPTPTIADKKQVALGENIQKTAPKQDLVEAVLEGNIGVVQDLLNTGADVNAKGKYGYTPLTGAVSQCSYVMVKTLLAKGADINAKADGGYTAMMSILETFRFVNGCGKENRSIVQALMDAKPDVNVKDSSGRTLWMYALFYGGIPDEIVDALLSKAANVNEKDNEGNTALMLYTNERIARVLLDRGADVNAKNSKGETPLMEAASRGRPAVMSLLIDKGAGINVMDKDGKTLLHRAADNLGEEAVKILLDKGLNVNARDNQERTPLMTAVSAWASSSKVIQDLLDKGADVNAKDNKGWTALLLAEEKRRNDIVEMLKKAGAK